MHPSLSLAEQERLIKLSEEASEVIKAASKVLQHGWIATGPDGTQYDNRKDLEDEIGDVAAIQTLMTRNNDIKVPAILKRRREKLIQLSKVLYHQN
jgi:NTP pyrophosphatase (non-canonical NTP hydrolase)